tara:strand:+ start:724 stop:894 length:171 start_codon:yes stop_codon:yes gene_type:complete
MAIAELFTLSKAYPVISIIIAGLLFFIGLRITAKLFKWLLWIIAIIAGVFGVYLLF